MADSPKRKGLAPIPVAPRSAPPPDTCVVEIKDPTPSDDDGIPVDAAPSAPPGAAPSVSGHLAVIGAGPIGLELALAALSRGLSVELFEKGLAGASHVDSYGFVQLFSPWKLNMTEAGASALKSLGVAPPDPESFPTGRELSERYLKHLLAALQAHPRCAVHFGSEVLAIGRGALLKGESIGGGDACMPTNKPVITQRRAQTPFRLLVEAVEERFFEGFDFVADCSGTYRADLGNWAGQGGVPAMGERQLRQRARLFTTIPDVLGQDRARFAGKRALLVGSGMSAATFARDMDKLRQEDGATKLLWVTRSDKNPFKIISDDVLPQRKSLCQFGNDASENRIQGVEPVSGAVIYGIEEMDGGAKLRVTISTSSGQRVEEVDEFVGLCGFQPDVSLYQELQVHACYASDGPMKLAATLIGASGDCLKQVSSGAESLKSPEPNFFILGSKSYGRNSAFLLKIGHEQVMLALEAMMAASIRGPSKPAVGGLAGAMAEAVQEVTARNAEVNLEDIPLEREMSRMSTGSVRSCWSTTTFIFNAVIQKGNAKLGIDINYHDNTTLLVTKVNPGPVEEYNVANPTNEIGPGDRIISVNGMQGNTKYMLERCRCDEELKLTVKKAVERTVPELRKKRPDQRLGINVEAVDGMTLLVTKIEEDGVVAEHNRNEPAFQIRVQDRIIGVNRVRCNAHKLLQELKSTDSWDITVRRIEMTARA